MPLVQQRRSIKGAAVHEQHREAGHAPKVAIGADEFRVIGQCHGDNQPGAVGWPQLSADIRVAVHNRVGDEIGP